MEQSGIMLLSWGKKVPEKGSSMSQSFPPKPLGRRGSDDPEKYGAFSDTYVDTVAGNSGKISAQGELRSSNRRGR